VKLQPFAQTARFGRLEGLVERRRAMRVQVVEHQANEFGLGVDHIKQPFNTQAKSCIVRRSVTTSSRQQRLGSQNPKTVQVPLRLYSLS
jgi:hypothetical protein